ncbi:MAG: N-acetylglutaminylglutamine synthetase [Hydrogenophaga sp.]|uniref:N-acetylglutaminylglutamine synthetase n=1 Tax=Hydrogenophaga sp. TaxID=1904254 RepID=UPI0016B9081A|nr:N-acetylglutaminylglutamine synthetase [Hydrogenophaga sp.]NIM43255.1 N-acetylglutaminylglutamine synthetase [Hydrogenophaga sp.]NIN28323.1 N-acetylglutaminylglutamine synthetase [Hydrogenophaga sp.]NIN29142.1 N-acetylglutaminylglutamine synthetase [Hydrogenophaga sp.]NIN57458.1 N-acetylglutaminylglutamine synthetase [Hydrogenophaga sp.]NIO53753.1 N-acetylglutaminylglutamine synthetase [Hydrogenophaga sp.]
MSTVRQHAPRALRLERSAIPHQATEQRNAIVHCGWGRLIGGHTFDDPAAIAQALLQETAGERDIAFYLDKPHVVVSHAPQQLFVDPSETFRLALNAYAPQRARRQGFTIRRLRSRADVAAINAIYRARRMVPVDPARVWGDRGDRTSVYVLAEDRQSGEVLGVAMGLDHAGAFGDGNGGSSLWALAVAPQASHPGIGEALTRYLAELFIARGRAFMDLSVLHDNTQAIALYKKLGFQNIPVFAVKRRNAINEPLFTEGADRDGLNPYARIIVDEAQRRGIRVEVIDAEHGYFRLTHGGRGVTCRESLSELTSAVAMSRCADKRVTARLLQRAGLAVPAQVTAGEREANEAFLRQHGAIVVKPVDSEQGKGIAVNLTAIDEVETAIEHAAQFGGGVLLEQFCEGQDLRIVVINHQVVAAAVRQPATVVGDGQSTIAELIDKQSRRRAAATGGESRIPVDGETKRCLAGQGRKLSDVLPFGESLPVRRTANLHTGGTIHDVTDRLHPALKAAAEQASRVLDIPVTGLDFLVPSVEGPDYVIIEANERPGLANHEPQPTAQRFVDLLFPGTAQTEVAAL